MSDVDDAPVDRLELALGYRFADRDLLATALSHPSYAHEIHGTRGNERLEFLGDAVLDLAIARLLYSAHPAWTEGELTRARAALVNQGHLAERAREIELGRFVKLGRTEQVSGGAQKDSILANCFEALVGAIYLEGGLDAVMTLAQKLFGLALGAGAAPAPDAKTELQEWSHARFRSTPTYRMVGDTGTNQDERRFTVEVLIASEPWGRGVGRSKQVAERAAAAAALACVGDAEGRRDPREDG
ncbi:MAG: ribonuclease III [Myxococcota bacterium]